MAARAIFSLLGALCQVSKVKHAVPCCAVRQAALGARNRTQYPIIEGVSGILRPGRLTLLLGPPGSGKSVLLRTLAGRMHKTPGVKVSGSCQAVCRLSSFHSCGVVGGANL